MAPSVFGAGYQHLRRYVDVRPGCLSGDLNAIRKRRGGGEGPAGSTVDRDMLVALEGQIVCATDVSPPEVVRDVLQGNFRALAQHVFLDIFILDVLFLVLEGSGQ